MKSAQAVRFLCYSSTMVSKKNKKRGKSAGPAGVVPGWGPASLVPVSNVRTSDVTVTSEAESPEKAKPYAYMMGRGVTGISIGSQF